MPSNLSNGDIDAVAAFADVKVGYVESDAVADVLSNNRKLVRFAICSEERNKA